MTDKTLGACQCHEKHAPTYWKGVVREYKDALEEAVRERDEANERAEKHRRAAVDHSTNARCWMQTSEEWQAAAEEWEKRARAAEQPRPLTPDAITDEMVERGESYMKSRPWTVSGLLRAALTEPPARPEGAENIEAAFDTWEHAEYLNGAIDAYDKRALADHIAEEMNR